MFLTFSTAYILVGVDYARYDNLIGRINRSIYIQPEKYFSPDWTCIGIGQSE